MCSLPHLLTFVHASYHKPCVLRYAPAEVVVSENGVDDPGEAALGLPDALRDDFRTSFFRAYVRAAEDAMIQDQARC